MDVWFDIVEKDKKRQRIKIFVYLSFLLPIATTPFAPECPGICPYSVAISISMLIWVIAAFYMNFFFITFKTLGIIRFQEDYIKILKNQYSIEIIKQLKIKINSYEGQTIGRYPSEGCDNIIILKLENGSILKYNFKITNKRETIIIPRFLKYYKERNINTLLLKGDKTIIK